MMRIHRCKRCFANLIQPDHRSNNEGLSKLYCDLPQVTGGGGSGNKIKYIPIIIRGYRKLPLLFGPPFSLYLTDPHRYRYCITYR